MFVLLLVAFFLSGAAALVYQVVWQRLLVIFSGADVYSLTIIVSAFMAGLGVGNLAGGHVADRVSRRTSLLLFAAAELAIAGFTVFSKTLYYDLLYQRLGPRTFSPVVMAGILFASLLWPTFFMGLSLPLLARALTERINRAATNIGALYGFNTLGAAMGAFVATWWILPRLGLEGSLRVGAMMNLACAAIALPVTRWLPSNAPDRLAPDSASAPGGSSSVPVDASPKTFPFPVWVGIYGLSGALALSLEIVWFRLLGVMMKSTAFTFGTLLTLYLTGLGSGAVLGSTFGARLRRPAIVFLALQAAVGLSAAFLYAMVVGVVADVRWFRNYFASYDPLSVQESVSRLPGLVGGLLGSSSLAEHLPWEFFVLYFAVPTVLIALPTALMGYSFAVLQSVVQTSLGRLGRRVGVLLLANISGSVFGTVVTGWLLLSVLGTAATLKLLVGLSGVFLFLMLALLLRTQALRTGASRAPVAVVACGVTGVVLALALLPNAATLWARLHGTTTNQIVFGEDASGLSVLRMERSELRPRTTVFVNGLGQSVMPYGDVHTALGAVPAFVHPHPLEAAVVGLGSGDTVYGLAGRQEIERVVCIEIIGSQLDTLKRLAELQRYGGLVGLLSDPRINHVAGDGRAYLMRSSRAYDIIEADALRPSGAYSGNLYSDAYFTLIRNRLRPKGLAATWSPTRRVHNAFIRVFPYVLSIPGILIGSDEPIELDRAAIAARLADPQVRGHYERAGVDIDQLLSFYLAEPALYGPDLDRSTLKDFNTDLFPKDEYDLGLTHR